MSSEHFCCSGCQLVYQILSAQEAKCYQSHPIYQQAVKSGLISHAHVATPQLKKSERLTLEIEGMWCSSCARLIELLLARKNICAIVDYATDLAIIDYDPMERGKDEVIEQITKLGYNARTFCLPGKQHLSFLLWLRFTVAAFCGLTLMMFAYPLYTGRVEAGYGATFGWVSFALAIPLLTFAAAPLWKRLWLSVRARILGMETLVLIAVSSAFIYSLLQLLKGSYHHLYFDSMAMVLVFVLLGNLLEKRAKFSAKESLFRMMRTLPRRACKCVDDHTIDVPVKEIQVDDILLVRSGEKVPFDGVVTHGDATLDESIMTGECAPCVKEVGSHLIGGSLLTSGQLYYSVSETKGLIGRVIHSIEEQLVRKTEGKSLLDHLLLYFVPLVLLIALFAKGLNSISVLLIACPCAIGIAIPLAESCQIGCFAKLGIIVRNRAVLTRLHKKPFFIFDKTGTLTHGEFELLTPFDDPYLTTLAKASRHPACVPLANGDCAKFDHIEERIGRGMIGSVGDKRFYLGSERLLLDEGIVFTPISSPHTVLYFVSDKVTPLILGDRVRANLPRVDGMILSGDRNEVVETIGHFPKWKGECDPFEKKAEVEKIKGRTVVMVGDGVNDAPAMAAADVAISMRSGSEMACEVADLIISDLSSIEKLATLSKKGMRIMHQNLFWAFIYNGVGIGLAFMGYLTPLYAAFAMVLSSLSVTLNSIRLSFNMMPKK